MSKKIKKVLSHISPLYDAATGFKGTAAMAAASVLGGKALAAGMGGGNPLSSVLKGSGLGSPAGTPLAGGLQGPTQGSGILGSLTRGTPGLSTALKGGIGGSGSGGISLSGIGNIASGLRAYGSQDDLEDQLLEAQGKAKGAIDPFYQSGLGANQKLSGRLAEGFQPGDLTQDPGYQFRLSEGQKALDRQLSASGMSQSGTAMKAAQEFGQGLADQTYNDSYQRWLLENNQLAGQAGTGYNAANEMGDIYGNMGNIGANANVARNNIMTGTLSSVLRGGGTRQIVGYDDQDNPIYAEV